jgi:hypothetical protein
MGALALVLGSCGAGMVGMGECGMGHGGHGSHDGSSHEGHAPVAKTAESADPDANFDPVRMTLHFTTMAATGGHEDHH